MFTFPLFLRAGREREDDEGGVRRRRRRGEGGRRVFKIHKGFVINASTTIKTKTLKGEKTCFCVKQLVLQH